MKQGQRLTENGHDVALFPMEVMAITAKPNEVGTTHELTLNIDLAGKDNGISNMLAPFTMKVAKNANTTNHEIIWWSTDLVKCSDGKMRLLTMRTLHDDDVSDLTVGKVFKQGEICSQEGNTGQSQGNHIHLSVAEGHTTSLIKRESGYHDLKGAIDPRNVFFINDTIIRFTRGTNWEIYKVPVIEPKPIEPVQETPIIEPVIDQEPVITPEPIIEPTPIEVEVPITNTNETQTTHHEPVNALYKIIIAIIELILKLIKGK